MYKKLVVIFLLVIASTILLMDETVSAEETESQERIQLLKREVAYGKLSEGEFYPLAGLLKGMEYDLVEETEEYFVLPFGNGEMYVRKDNARKVGKANYSVEPEPFITNIVTKSEVSVYNQSKPGGKVIGKIKKGIRVPIKEAEAGFYQVQFGGQIGYIYRKSTEEDTGIPVLMYHHLANEKSSTIYEGNLSVLETNKFREQMRYLKQNGWRTVDLHVFEEWIKGKATLPDKVFLITFDDGYLSNVEYAYDYLKRLDFKAISFLISSKVPEQSEAFDLWKYQYIGANDIMRTDDVFNYQLHTHDFHRFNSKTNKSYLESESTFAISNDLNTGSTFLTSLQNAENEILSLAYPYGKTSDKALTAMEENNIRLGFTIREGTVKMFDDPLRINRIRIHSQHTLEDFAKKLTNSYNESEIASTK